MVGEGNKVSLKIEATPLSAVLSKVLQELPVGAAVLDVGCLGWKLFGARQDLAHGGCDMFPADAVPEGVEFKLCDVDSQDLPWPDDHFDLVVASHLIEHLNDPVRAASEMFRVCRPGGLIYIEAPSDRSLRPFPFSTCLHDFYSFWDDPTHIRPWSPGALYRLYVGLECEPVVCDYDRNRLAYIKLPYCLARYWLTGRGEALQEAWWKAVGFVAHGLGRKPVSLKGTSGFRYISLRGVSVSQVREHFRGIR